MRHIKRISSPKSWIIPRKGTKYVLRPYPGKKSEMTMPLGMLVRDLLNLTHNKKETRAFLKGKELMVDGKVIEEEKFPISLFDTIAIVSLKKFYRMIIIENGKLGLEEIKADEIKSKIYKIIGKTSLRKGKTQLNLFNGRNIITDKDVKVNDSVLVDLDKNLITKHFPLKAGAEIYIIGGKHLGEYGKIKDIKEKNVQVEIKGKVFDIKIKSIYVLK